MKIIISENIIKDQLKFENIHLDYVSGEHMYELLAKIDNKVVGRLDYGVYEGEPNVKMLNVTLKRMGIGTQLLKQLQSLFPEQEIDLGSSTDEGSALIQSLHREFIPNKEYLQLNNKLQFLKKERERILNAVQSNDRSEINKLNDISDEIYELETELKDMEEGKWIIK